MRLPTDSPLLTFVKRVSSCRIRFRYGLMWRTKAETEKKAAKTRTVKEEATKLVCPVSSNVNTTAAIAIIAERSVPRFMIKSLSPFFGKQVDLE